MYYSKSLLIGVALVAPTAIEAFVLISPSRAHSSLDALRCPNNDERGATAPDAAIRHFTATSALALGLLFPAVSFAAPTVMQSSSVQVRNVIYEYEYREVEMDNNVLVLYPVVSHIFVS